MISAKYVEDNFQFVLIRSPYEIMEIDLVSSIFPKLISLKKNGYRKEYGNFALPFDSSDFVATHLLLCQKETRDNLHPVLGFKSITLEKCDNHRISFPMLSFFDPPHCENHYQNTVCDLLDNYRKNGKGNKIAYNGSFTISPELRENKELMKHFWDITFSLLTNYYIDYQIDHVLAICATKFKIHEKKEKLGWNYITGNYGELRPYVCHSFFQTNVVPMELYDVKSKSLGPSLKFKRMWERRITLDVEILNLSKRAA